MIMPELTLNHLPATLQHENLSYWESLSLAGESVDATYLHKLRETWEQAAKFTQDSAHTLATWAVENLTDRYPGVTLTVLDPIPRPGYVLGYYATEYEVTDAADLQDNNLGLKHPARHNYPPSSLFTRDNPSVVYNRQEPSFQRYYRNPDYAQFWETMLPIGSAHPLFWGKKIPHLPSGAPNLDAWFEYFANEKLTIPISGLQYSSLDTKGERSFPIIPLNIDITYTR
jgi:hypothetical protein